ncbi:MAG: hypothetical protein IKT47_07900 [Oscillospiraceae bacterium]|nr:hypothetical protein [Oscillospiraceae bacterium]
MTDKVQKNIPELFRKLMELCCLSESDVCGTADGFFAASVAIADILAQCGITTVPGNQGEELECRLFFDDWYIYAVSVGESHVYSLFKMREQECDAKMGLHADGDTPGVTIPFIALREEILVDCLCDSTQANRKKLEEEINRVVAHRGQRHSDALKQYFIRTESQGAYLIAELYTEYIASLAAEGYINVPKRYEADFGKLGLRGRVAQFIEANNSAAGRVVCDHKKVYICDPKSLMEYERMAILATHTGNASFFSFAAEVQFHARFLTWWAKLRIPFMGNSPYDSAVRADMSIGDAELTGPTPYYRLDSRIVRAQYERHKDKYLDYK